MGWINFRSKEVKQIIKVPKGFTSTLGPTGDYVFIWNTTSTEEENGTR